MGNEFHRGRDALLLPLIIREDTRILEGCLPSLFLENQFEIRQWGQNEVLRVQPRRRKKATSRRLRKEVKHACCWFIHTYPGSANSVTPNCPPFVIATPPHHASSTHFASHWLELNRTTESRHWVMQSNESETQLMINSCVLCSGKEEGERGTKEESID